MKKIIKYIKISHLVLLIILVLALIFGGCTSTTKQYATKEYHQGANISILIIDSCEYLMLANDTRTLTHKGNCKFCVKRNKFWGIQETEK